MIVRLALSYEEQGLLLPAAASAATLGPARVMPNSKILACHYAPAIVRSKHLRQSQSAYHASFFHQRTKKTWLFRLDFCSTSHWSWFATSQKHVYRAPLPQLCDPPL